MEVFASILSFLCIWCAVKEKVLTFPFGMVGMGLYSMVFLSQKAYSSMSLQIFFFIFYIYGWYKWKHPSKELAKSDNTLAITLLTPNRRIVSVVLIAFFTLLLGYATANFHIWLPALFENEAFSHISPEYRHLCIFIDAYILAASLTAQYLLAIKKLENWIIWLTVDCLSAPFYALTVGIPTGILYFTFIFLGIAGLREWNKNRQNALNIQSKIL